jgi:hypothetical protein
MLLLVYNGQPTLTYCLERTKKRQFTKTHWKAVRKNQKHGNNVCNLTQVHICLFLPCRSDDHRICFAFFIIRNCWRKLSFKLESASLWK